MLNSMIRTGSRKSANLSSTTTEMDIGLLQNELSRTSWLIAVVGSILNASRTSGDTAPLSQITYFLPNQLGARLLSSHYDNNSAQALVMSLDQFYGQVDMARRVTASRLSAFLNRPPEAADDDVPRIVEILSETWRKLALAAQLQLYQLQSVVARAKTAGATVVSQDIIVQLKQVVRGDSPCIDSAGVAQFGGLLDRRGAPRVVVRMNVMVISHGISQPCVVTNVSSSGLGLGDIYRVSTGEEIWIRVADGIELPGRVVWADQGHAGVELQHELSAADWLEMPRTVTAGDGWP